jgi:Cof subfamily protein (haloacid dehalogenase superfamily)
MRRTDQDGGEGERPDIALVISDVDGTLVTTDKTVTPAAAAAIRRLDEAGIAFTVASSRPPIGLAGLVDRLGLRLPMGAFNGATVVGPDLATLSETLIPEATAREAADRLQAAGLDLWVFAQGRWWLRDGQAPYTDVERRTLQAEPAITADLGPLLGSASKLVGVSPDFAHLAACEARLAQALGPRAAVHRSQAYYLDVTPPGLDKGSFVTWMSRHLDIPEHRIATFGDAGNDVAMFARSGLAVAMGNADSAVQAKAGRVTASNDADGFAEGVARFILP